MNLETPMVKEINGVPVAVRLMWMEGQRGVEARESEAVIEELWVRATEVGPVLEGILHETHAESHWD